MRKMKRPIVLLLSLLLTGLFIVACDDSGDSDSEKPSIYNTWTTNGASVDVEGSYQLDFASAKLILKNDNTFTFSYSGTLWWISSSNVKYGAPEKKSYTGNVSYDDANSSFTFSCSDGTTTYKYTFTYYELALDSVKLDCTLVTTRTDTTTATTDTFTFTCKRG